uniref:Uncharacterized protein n=1 Tax=Globisporangium ultimum (strain ATCC 200006 / CBS 805.95 / DAOM BR144) TaxID=431595 RepID=K3WD45_GLOUD
MAAESSTPPRPLPVPRANQSGSARASHHSEPSSTQQQPQRQKKELTTLVQQQQERQIDAIKLDTTKQEKRLQNEIQWIHAHLPVLHLATSKYSLPFRQRLFVSTIVAHLTRANLRSHWCHWMWVVAQEKQVAFTKMRASQRVLELFETISMDRLLKKFRYWHEWVLESQHQEQLAAAIMIQQFIQSQRARRALGAKTRAAQDLKQALDMMNAHAVRIQRRYQTHVQVYFLQSCQHAATKLQRRVRHYQRHRRLLLETRAARRIQRVFRRHLGIQQATFSAMVAHAFVQHKARVIQRFWRHYAAWKHAILPPLYMAYLVDQVEFAVAIDVVQRHFRGFLCRRHVKTCHRSARRIQHCWRGFQRRVLARQTRKTEILQRQLAACCLQRTLVRNREQRRFRKMMQHSARPMYLRARDFEPAQRAKAHVMIVKSAVFVMQNTWRKHVRYVVWKQTRTQAALVLQLLLRRVIGRQKWRRLVLQTSQLQQDQRRWNAAQRIQTCWYSYRKRQADKAGAACLQQIEQLARLVRASCCLQRCYRRHRDPWCRVLRRVLYVDLPRQRSAVQCIRTQWLQYAARKQALLQQFHGLELPPSLSKGMDLQQLQQLLLEQELQMQRENAAAKCIQRMFHRMIDARDGKRLLQKYRILMRQEMKRRQQRRIIHEYLSDKETKKRVRKPQPTTTTSVVASNASTPALATIVSGSDHAATKNVENDVTLTSLAAVDDVTDPNAEEDSESVQYWSDEYLRAYLFNPRTGESTWL